MADGRTSYTTQQMVQPSTLLIDLEMEVPVSINIVFESLGVQPVHLAIQQGRPTTDIQHQLFGRDKDVNWFRQIFGLLGKLQVANKAPRRSNLIWQYKVKTLSVLLNLLLFRLIEEEPVASRQLVQNLLFASLEPLLFIKNLPSVKEVFIVGAPLFTALYSFMKHEVDQISVRSLANALKEEQLRVISSALNMIGLSESAKDLEQFLSVHSRRYQVTVFLLCDLISINPDLITPASLRFMLLLGNYLEMEGVICHDLVVWNKNPNNNNNVYQFWLRITNKVHSTTTPEEFMNHTKVLLHEKKDKLLADGDAAAPFFDLSLFIKKETSDVVQQYYEIMEIMLQAKL